jgi:hypothetical protein
LRDERFLPFEGAGGESTWKLDLPKDYPAFDYATISDVILHIRYTARQGVDPTKVTGALKDQLPPDGSNLALLFSLRHDFPTEWSAFVNDKQKKPFTATIKQDYFPYFVLSNLARGKKISILALELYDALTMTHRAVNDSAASPFELSASAPQFSFSVQENNVLVRSTDAQVFLVLRYSLSDM